MPFLALATNPESAINSSAGRELVKLFPGIAADNILLLTGITTITLLIASSIINGVTDYFRSRYAYFSGMKIGGYLLNCYANQPYIFHLKHNSSELVKRLQSDVNMFMSGVLAPFLEILARSINVLLLLILLLVINPVICILVTVVFSLLLSLSFVIFRRPVVRGNLERKHLISERFLSAHQLLGGIKTAIVHHAQDYFTRRFVESWRKIAAHDSFVAIASSGPRYTIEAVAFSSIVLLVLLIQSKGQSLQEILPSLVFFVIASYRMLPALQSIYGQITKIQSQTFALDTLYEDFQLFGQRPLPQKVIGKLASLEFNQQIAFDNVTYRYPESDKLSLQNISFTIEKGSKIGVVGASGAGKSTLVDLLIGLLEPTLGDIYIDDQVLSPDKIVSWQKLVGYVSQDIFLLDDTIRSNIAFGIQPQNIIEAQVFVAAQVAQIHDYIMNDLPEGYNTLCGERGTRLSGGQRQRIALARALYHQPSVLIFDEATSALDNQTERNLVAAIDSLPDHFTIITVAHRLSTVKKCDRILVFDQGRLLDSGTYEDLLDHSLTFKQLATQNHP